MPVTSLAGMCHHAVDSLYNLWTAARYESAVFKQCVDSIAVDDVSARLNALKRRTAVDLSFKCPQKPQASGTPSARSHKVLCCPRSTWSGYLLSHCRRACWHIHDVLGSYTPFWRQDLSNAQDMVKE
jgi:hypothetical protein